MAFPVRLPDAAALLLRRYTSYLAPITASKLHADVRAYNDLEHFETAYVVKLHSVATLSPPQPVRRMAPHRAPRGHLQECTAAPLLLYAALPVVEWGAHTAPLDACRCSPSPTLIVLPSSTIDGTRSLSFPLTRTPGPPHCTVSVRPLALDGNG